MAQEKWERVDLREHGFKWLIAIVDPREIRMIDKNAHYFDKSVFAKLVENIQQDGDMTSIPFCHIVDGQLEAIAGNHRIQAAIEAGIPRILALYHDGTFTQSEKRSRQLSSNALVGKDDKKLLFELFQEIEELEWKKLSGIEESGLLKSVAMDLKTLSEIALEYKFVILGFLPDEVEKLEKILAQIDMVSQEDKKYLLKRKEYDKFLEKISRVKIEFNIKNNSAALLKMMDMAEAYLSEHSNK
jgi:hypothetical protein